MNLCHLSTRSTSYRGLNTASSSSNPGSSFRSTDANLRYLNPTFQVDSEHNTSLKEICRYLGSRKGSKSAFFNPSNSYSLNQIERISKAKGLQKYFSDKKDLAVSFFILENNQQGYLVMLLTSIAPTRK